MPASTCFRSLLRVERAHVFVNVRQHVRRRFLRLAVKAEYRQLEMLVKIEGDKLPGLRVAAHAVLRPVKRRELHVRLRAEPFDDWSSLLSSPLGLVIRPSVCRGSDRGVFRKGLRRRASPADAEAAFTGGNRAAATIVAKTQNLVRRGFI